MRRRARRSLSLTKSRRTRRRKSLCGAIGGRKRRGGLDPPCCAAVRRGERFGLVEMSEAFPVLQELVEAEADATQCGRCIAAESGGKSEHDCFLTLFGQPGLAG